MFSSIRLSQSWHFVIAVEKSLRHLCLFAAFVSVCKTAKERVRQRGKTNRGRDMDRNERAPGHAKTLATAVPTLRCHSVLVKPPSGWASLGRPLFLADTRTSTLAQTSGSTWVNYKAAPSMLGRKGVREKLCKLGQKAREGRKGGPGQG